jgi:RNA polymerase sigma factor (sigma-70 family)
MAQGLEDFRALLDRARRGDDDALAQIACQYESKVRIVARVLLGPALRPYLDSMDLVQSVHRSLLIGLREAKFDVSNPDKLLALALTLVRRKVARKWRHLQKQKRFDSGPNDSENLATLLTSLSSPEPDPARAAQFNDSVRKLCASLDDTERQMMDLRLQGNSTKEIASALQLNPIALRVRMTRLRRRLQSAGVLDDWL